MNCFSALVMCDKMIFMHAPGFRMAPNTKKCVKNAINLFNRTLNIPAFHGPLTNWLNQVCILNQLCCGRSGSKLLTKVISRF